MTRTIGMRLLAIAGTCVWTWAVPSVAFALESECPAAGESQIRLLREIVDVVKADDFGAAGDLVDRVWSTQEDDIGWIAPSLEGIGAWMAHSQSLEEIEFCIDDQGRATGYFLNQLTGMVDLVRISVNEADRVTNVAVRTAVRPEVPQAVVTAEPERLAILGEYVRGLASDGMFSGTVLLAKDGKPVYFESFGFADREAGTSLGDESSYNVASLNKIFTAVAVLQLVERGDLRLDTRLADVLPDKVQSEAAAAIRIDHLLSHTSGAMSGLDALEFPPGTEFAYSNYGYGLLGQVIEAVTHMKYHDYMRLYILGPAGMARTASYQLMDSEQLIPGLVRGYRADVAADSLVFIPNPWLQKYPGSPVGGYYSTAGDLLEFANHLVAGELISGDSVALMRSAKPELGAVEYGFGTMLWRGPGIWGHAGDLPGADADLEIYGDTGYVAVVLGNFDENNPPVLMKIRSLFFPGSVPTSTSGA